jgi:hypothetical protein
MMAFDLSRRVGLFVAHGVGTGIVFEKQEDGGRVPIRIFGGPDAARLWVDSHYADVEWESPHRATASVGRLSEPVRPPPAPGEGRSWEHRPVTYETADLRTYLPELMAGANGPVILQQCGEYVAESDRWETFVSILWESTW